MQTVKLSTIIYGLEMVDQDTRVYLNTDTMDVEAFSDYDEFRDEEEDYSDNLIELPSAYDINMYHCMELFIQTVEDSTQKEWLGNAIHGKGAFRMFRATCDRFGLTTRYYKFQDEYRKDIAIEWCLENGIPYEIEEETPVKEEQFDWNDEEQFKPVTEQVEKKPKKVKDKLRIVELTEQNEALCRNLFDEYLEYTHDETPLEDMIDALDVYLATYQGMMVGFVVYNQYCYGKSILETIYVRKSQRRNGIGTQLLQYVLEKDTDVRIFVEPDQEATLAFLKANGYNKTIRVQIGK